MSALAPVGFVAEDDVLICVESLEEELLLPLELVPTVGAELLDDVALFDRSMARVGSVGEDDALQCVESVALGVDELMYAVDGEEAELLYVDDGEDEEVEELP